MILGYIFFWAVLGSCLLLALDRMAQGLVIECASCGRERVRRGYCSHCGVVGNPVPVPTPQRRSPVRFH